MRSTSRPNWSGVTSASGRRWPAMALTTDASILTAVGNDYGFDRVFARQVEALGRPGDVALASRRAGHRRTSCRRIEAANARGLVTIALTGGRRGGGEAGGHSRQRPRAAPRWRRKCTPRCCTCGVN